MHERDQSQSVLKGAFFKSNLKYLTVFVFFSFISKSVNNRCYNPYIDGKISKKSTKKRLYENGRIQKFIKDNSRFSFQKNSSCILNRELSAINFRILPFS